jgi:hypothetical protein
VFSLRPRPSSFTQQSREVRKLRTSTTAWNDGRAIHPPRSPWGLTQIESFFVTWI